MDTEYEGMTLETLRKMSADAEPGLWFVADFMVEDGFGKHKAYALANPMGKHICDTMNGDLQVIHQDDGPRFDQAGSDNMEFAAACVNYVRSLLRPAPPSTSETESQLRDGEPVMAKRVDIDLVPYEDNSGFQYSLTVREASEVVDVYIKTVGGEVCIEASMWPTIKKHIDAMIEFLSAEQSQ